jgi:hypothetical protein
MVRRRWYISDMWFIQKWKVDECSIDGCTSDVISLLDGGAAEKIFIFYPMLF